MPRVSTQVEVASTDNLRVRPRPGGGFHLLIGDGEDRAILSFAKVETAEAMAAVLCTSAITHGPLGTAVAETAPERSNVARFPLRTVPTDTPPLDAA